MPHRVNTVPLNGYGPVCYQENCYRECAMTAVLIEIRTNVETELTFFTTIQQYFFNNNTVVYFLKHLEPYALAFKLIYDLP